jgi:hypothetical protein
MIEDMAKFIEFLIEAKRKTYAGEGRHAPSCRPASIDLPYQRGDYDYLDTYLGGLRFAGEEAVWHKGRPAWAMNYYGWMLAASVPDGFGEFLKRALLKVTPQAPYRGPANYRESEFEYRCQWDGTPERFEGREQISLGGKPVYELVFHGGTIES